ncbi:MAG: response regulator [Opitutae bacterium]|nr:response regulator [Opitutae bacterium]
MSHHTSLNKVTILIAEDDDGHAELIQQLLEEVGVRNPLVRFRDGQEVLDFLRGGSTVPPAERGQAYLLLLDIRMPRVDGVEVLRQLKADAVLKNIPIIMLTTTDDPREVQSCYQHGCNCYVTKPVEFEQFASVLKNLGMFLLIVKVPQVGS